MWNSTHSCMLHTLLHLHRPSNSCTKQSVTWPSARLLCECLRHETHHCKSKLLLACFTLPCVCRSFSSCAKRSVTWPTASWADEARRRCGMHCPSTLASQILTSQTMVWMPRCAAHTFCTACAHSILCYVCVSYATYAYLHAHTVHPHQHHRHEPHEQWLGS